MSFLYGIVAIVVLFSSGWFWLPLVSIPLIFVMPYLWAIILITVLFCFGWFVFPIVGLFALMLDLVL